MLSSFCLYGFLWLANTKGIKATVKMERPDHHFFQVELVFPKSKYTERVLKMANWIPGSYKIRDFARNVEQFGAFELDGGPLNWRKTDKSTWLISVPRNTSFKVTYQVFAYEFSVRTSYLDSFYGYINPPSVFLYEPNALNVPYEVEIDPWQDWRVASSLPNQGVNSYLAADWDELVDSPFQFGTFRRHDFEVQGIPHRWIIAGDVNMNEMAMLEELKKIGETVGNLFGGYPFKDYTFFSQFRLDGAGGGLEHLNSTVVQGHSNRLRGKKGWDRFLGLLIHEYFHAWNVKSIRDKVLGPFDYQQEVYTDLLWLHEGWTSYYDTILMVRAGFWKDKDLLKDLARQVDAYLNSPATSLQSMTDASFNAWIHQYQPSQTFSNSRISYYRMGAMSGLALDLLIRHKTKNKGSLDDVMRLLYKDYALEGRSIDWASVVNAVNQIVGKSGVDFLTKYVQQANPMPMDTFLAYAGIELVYKDEKNNDDEEKPSEDDEAAEKTKPYAPNPKVSLGITTRTDGKAVVVQSVKRGKTGWEAGLDFGDEILAINDRRVFGGNFDEVLGWSRPGDEVLVLVSRGNKILTIPVTLAPHPQKLTLVHTDEAEELQKSIYNTLFKFSF